MSKIRDAHYMQLALLLAERGRKCVSPNPMVGCVIVRGKRIVGEGWHQRFGGPHAEVLALKRAGSRARGAPDAGVAAVVELVVGDIELAQVVP